MKLQRKLHVAPQKRGKIKNWEELTTASSNVAGAYGLQKFVMTLSVVLTVALSVVLTLPHDFQQLGGPLRSLMRRVNRRLFFPVDETTRA